MAVPKKRTSKSRQRKRRATIFLETPHLIHCTNCGEETLPHTVCPSCGFYDGRKVIEGKKEKEEAKKKKKEKETKA